MYKFLLVFLIFFCGCSRNELPSTGGPVKPLVMEGFTMTETEDGKKKLVVKAESAEIDKNNNIIKANNVNLKYYDSKGNVSSILTSETGILELGTKDMTAEGNVILTTDIDAKLETEKLKWLSAENKVFTDEPVRFTKGGNVLKGKGLEADSRLENATVKEVVTEVTNLKTLDMTKKPKVSQRPKVSKMKKRK